MKIDLKFPYDQDWKYGYLVINPEGRRTLILYNSHSNRSSTSYSRYLVAVNIGRYLLPEEHVDHIDENKTNDSIENLQILTLSQNNIKSNKKPDIELICPVCGIKFTRSLTQLRGRKHKIKDNLIACSRRCGGKKSHGLIKL